MNTDPTPPQPPTAHPDATIQHAIRWLNTTSTGRELVEGPDGPTTPGHLLHAALTDLDLTRLLTGAPHSLQQAMTVAQAQWLIRAMPAEDTPPAVDSAQQAGRAWGVLITTDTHLLPSSQVLAEVTRRTGLSPHTTAEITQHATTASAAYTRADRLAPYDRAPDHLLIEDLQQLTACGPHLPDAAARAGDVLDLLTARTTDPHHFRWITDTETRHTAHTCHTLIQTQPLLTPLATLLPDHHQPPGTPPDHPPLPPDLRHILLTAATAAARARAVQQWADHHSGPQPTRAHTLQSAGPRTRTLLRLNQALALAHHGDAHPTLTPEDLARLAAAITQLTTTAAAPRHRNRPRPAGTGHATHRRTSRQPAPTRRRAR